MTDPIDSGAPPADYKKPKRGRAVLKDLVLIVRPGGNPAGVRVYTEEQMADAEAYARTVGADVQRLL